MEVPSTETYSVRLVNVDYYLCNPIPEIDVVLSEFRGTEIKQVPIIRIFGSNSQGDKVCAHIHGVFPYLLIPCERVNPEPSQLYQIANGIDKALNISLKQSNSLTQHVYQVSLVQGIPFYGFHSKPHQFYKVFLYNPGLLKRTADLLQNGAIMGLSYQPHEAHINFIMQFFIDFNLYGMSYINMEYVKFRRKPSSIEMDISSQQLLTEEGALSTATSKFEIDCLAQHILNRQSILNGETGVNPGLAALWEDEKIRVNKLNLSENLAITPTQLRENVKMTNSHTFFHQEFSVKLALFSENLDTSISESLRLSDSTQIGSPDQNKSTQEKMSDTIIYPPESSFENQILSANSVTLHHPSSILMNITDINCKTSLDDTVVDESIILKYSQNDADSQINSQDKDLVMLLENMQQDIEENSILGSQPFENEDDDEDLVQNPLNNLNVEENKIKSLQQNSDSWDNTFWDNIENLSQLDGSSDIKERKQPRKRKQPLRLGLSKKISKSKEKTTSLVSGDENSVRDKINEFKLNLSPHKSPKSTPRKKKNYCRLSIMTKISPMKSLTPCNNTPTKLIMNHYDSDDFDEPNLSNCVNESHTNNLNIMLIPLPKTEIDNQNCGSLPGCSKNLSPISLFSKSNNEAHDQKEQDYEPLPGCSKYLSPNLISASNNEIDNQKNQNFEPVPGCSKYLSPNHNLNFSSDSEIDSRNLGVVSFYDKSYFQITNMSSDEECFGKISQEDTNQEQISMNNLEKSQLKYNNYILIPRNPPPSRLRVISSMIDYNIPRCKYENPFYSNYKDVGHQIEIGQLILKVKSKHLSDLNEFESMKEIKTINEYRNEKILNLNNSQTILPSKNVSLLITGNEQYCLIPSIKPPRRKDVNEYLISLKKQICEPKTKSNDINIKKEKNMHIPLSPGQDMNESDCEMFSLSPCSPLISANENSPISHHKEIDTFHETPKASTSKIISNKKRQSYSQNSNHSLRRRSLRLSLAENSLSQNIRLEFVSSNNTASSDKLPTLKTDENVEKNLISMVLDEKNITKNVNTGTENLNLTETLGFKHSGENYQKYASSHEYEHLTLISADVIADTRGDYNPDPDIDPVLGFFYYIYNDYPETYSLPQSEAGMIIISSVSSISIQNQLTSIKKCCKIQTVCDESSLFAEVSKLIAKWDPDILCGYETELMSWGYLFQRSFKLDMNLSLKISRLLKDSEKHFSQFSQENNKKINVTGRILLNVWRLMRHEIALTNYSFENVTYHVLHERVPKFSYKTLSFWWNHPSQMLKNLAVEYIMTRVNGTVTILQQLDIIGRTSELAKLFGIQWYEVLSRGSQFRVESMMIRMSRPWNYVMVSPSIQQRASMKAPESLPLILEPESRFYKDPIIVLDFQSLYPSMMIAYNYCYSTCVGKVNNMKKNSPFEFGATRLQISHSTLKKLNDKDAINWSPCGVGFVKPFIRKGTVPKMLEDILSTRFMVKKAMKKHKTNKTLQKILHSRQLGLKLIANVTYGYTAANFSGRMPCSEVGDSVVSKGRETLERAIKMIENTPEWDAKVVYGDTDSLFVLVAEKNRDEAFEIGEKIAYAVTNDNPNPVKLKLEKIYQPCILQTKKRYVGYMYESKDQKVPEFNAKGIETVRRDGCPLTAKMLEKCLRILFDTNDVSKVKNYVCKKFQNIVEGKTSIRDFIFAKEFRGMSSYKPGAAVPALEIAKKIRNVDPRKEPREGERVPYVIISGAPGQPLLHLARDPKDVINDPNLKIDFNYYITRVVIPPINRCFTLMGVDLRQWLNELPRKQIQRYPILDDGRNNESKKTISQYFAKINCAVCDRQTTDGLCDECLLVPNKSVFILQSKINEWERKYNIVNKICQSCCGRSNEINCISIDCPILYKKSICKQDLDQKMFLEKMMNRITIEL